MTEQSTRLEGPLLAAYSEGVVSASNVDQCICFLRVIDHVLTIGGPALRSLWVARHPRAQWIEFNATLPTDIRRRYDNKLVEVSYIDVLQRYSRQVSGNGFAAKSKDRLGANLARESQCSIAAAVLGFVAHRLFCLTSINARTLRDCGASEEELLTAFYRIRRPQPMLGAARRQRRESEKSSCVTKKTFNRRA
jgi:hypothetical protein